jgi:glycosyltransferase involved in cell wall biosynthesis
MFMKEDSSSTPRLCFIGSMVGRNPGHITQQGQVLSDLFEGAGYKVASASSFLNRYRRLIDIASTITRQRRQTDILIIEVYGGPSFVVEDIASRLGRHFGHRVVMWLHGGALPEFMARYPRWSRRVFSRADVIVTPSEFLARAMSLGGFKARIIPNVIDFPSYPYRHRREVRPRLFWMRNIHPIWNPEMAIRVLARLKVDHPDATLVMGGPDKGTQSEVKRLAESLGLGGSVRFTGFLDMEGKRREGSAADIYINTNRIDNSPVAVVEACAMGMPVVTTEVGGIPDLLKHSETALFVPDDDDQAMAQSIQNLISRPELAALLSSNGRILAEKFSWRQVRSQWEDLFAELMGYHNRTELARPHLALRAGAYCNDSQSNTNLTETL